MMVGFSRIEKRAIDRLDAAIEMKIKRRCIPNNACISSELQDPDFWYRALIGGYRSGCCPLIHGSVLVPRLDGKARSPVLA